MCSSAKHGGGGGDVGGKSKAKNNLADLFISPHELLFNGGFEEAIKDDVCERSSAQLLHR